MSGNTEFLNVIEEVTDNYDYKNSNIAKKIKKNML